MKMVVTSSLVFASESTAHEEISKAVPMPPLPCALGLLKLRAASVNVFCHSTEKSGSCAHLNSSVHIS